MKLLYVVLTLLAMAECRRGRDRHTTTRPPPTTTTTVKTTTTTPTTTTTTTTPKPTTTTAKPTMTTTKPTTTTAAPVNDGNTAYFAFKIEDAKISQRVQKLHQAALKVSKDFSPFLINTTKLYQPLISFRMEDDEKSRQVEAKEIYDRQLELALCSMLPRRLPYTQFKVVDGAMKAMSETGEWMYRTKAALRDALNRNGFILSSNLDENLVVIMNPLKLNLAKVDLRSLPLAASAYVDSLYICRGRAPSASFASPCEIVHESFLDGCPSTLVKDASLADLIYAQGGKV